MPSNCIFYFYSQWNDQDLLLKCLGKGNVFPFTESARGLLRSEGYGRHHWHSCASLTAAQPTIAKALHHGPAFQQFQPCGRLPPLGSGGITFLDAALETQSGRFRWGPGMWLQLKNPQLRAGEVFWTGLFEVNQVGLGSPDTRAELLSYQHDWAFPPPAACLILSSQTYSLLSVYQNCLIYSYRGFGGSEFGFCHSWRAATECPSKLSALETEAQKAWKQKAWQPSRARQRASPLFLIHTPVSPPKVAPPKNKGKNKPRRCLPLWPLCPAITWLLVVHRKLSVYYFLWQIRDVVRSTSSCYGKTDVGGKCNLDQIYFLQGKKLLCWWS